MKRYGRLFSCFTTQGIHIEMLNSSDSDDFLSGRNSFMCSRGNLKNTFKYWNKFCSVSPGITSEV